MTIKPELYRASSDPDTWRLFADAVNQEFALIDMDAARRTATEFLSEKDAETERNKAIEPARAIIQQINYQQWGGYRMHYTLGQLDTDMLVLLAERRHIGWQDIFNAKAAFGTPDDLEKIRTQALKFGTTFNPNNSLSTAARPMQLVSGMRFEGNAATTEYLFKLGADPAYDNNGALFNQVVDAGRADIGHIFARYGQNGILNVEAWANSARTNRKFKLYEDLRRIQWNIGRYHVIDNNTLLETKPLPDNAGSLKVLFNFASRRVIEIMETTNPRQAQTQNYSFDDYGPDALENARDKLLELGAQPAALDVMRGKSVISRPAARGLPDKP